MHIYIDESGSFTTPIILMPKISCITALIIPSAQNDEIINEYLKIRSSWGESEEIKGSKLNESQIAQVIELLSNYEVIAEICAIDIGSHTKQDIADYQRLASLEITKHLTPSHSPRVISSVYKLRRRLAGLSQSLAVQFFLTISLIQKLLVTTTIYYAQKLPKELGEFNWFVDAKGMPISNYEKLWTLLILPMTVQTLSPFYLVEDDNFNYSYFERFSIILDHFPYYLEHTTDNPDSEFKGTDFKMIMQESFKFDDSKQNVGLQLVDIVASAFSRAMNRHLQKQGWENLGKLFIKKPSQIVQVAVLNPNPQNKGREIRQRNFFGYVIENLERKANRNLY